MIVSLAMSSAADKLEVPPGTMTAGVEVHYRLDRTLAPLEGFVNDMLITTLSPISNRIREFRRQTPRGRWRSRQRNRHSQTPRWRSNGARLSLMR
jgi:hypothetical protein